MANTLINAAPMVDDRGTEDLSTRQVPREADAIPQHLPKCYIFAERGDTRENLRVGAERDRTYGTKTFDPRSKFANHATIFANAFNANGNACVYKRLIPEDAGPCANVTLWLDVLPTTVDLYERNVDGSIKLDALGQPIVTGTTTGHKVKWVTTNYTTHTDFNDKFGIEKIAPGDQVDAVSGTQSTRYAIHAFALNSQGDYGNRLGFRMWAPTAVNSRLPVKMMNTAHAYPYTIAIIEKPETLTTPKIKETLFGEQNYTFVTKPQVIDPATDRAMYVQENFVSQYSSLADPRYPDIVADFDKYVLHQDNVDYLTELFHEAEIPFVDNESDFDIDPEQKHLFNYVSGVDSNNRPYHSFVFVDDANSVRLTPYTNVYAAGGSDGTLNNDVFAELVSQDVRRYLDREDPIQDIPGNPESIIYDSGFPLATKLDLLAFIGQRRDTFAIVGTHVAGGPTMTASEEHSMAIALRTRAQSYPESDYFGTPVMRAMIIGRSGRVRNSQYRDRLPLTYEIAVKSAKYMGAGDGRWKNGFHFDGAPGSVLDSMYDINITWVSESVRNRNWDVGLNWVQRYDLKSFFFPALKTVYDNDTSVLNSYITAMAICQLNKVAHAVWREFSGVSHLTNGQLVDRVNSSVRDKVRNKFDGRFVIEPNATVTEMDALLGFRWTLPIKIYAANMKTNMVTYVQAYRMEDLENQTNP